MDAEDKSRMQASQGDTGSLLDPVSLQDALLMWLPNETLFSLCSRHHRLWGYAVSRQTTEVLFTGCRAGTLHDFPGALAAFASRTQQHLGSPATVARERTLLKFYRPFLAPTEVEHIARTMEGRSVAHLKFRMGLLTSRFRANHPLKACVTCMEQDIKEYGWVYWHLEHQYPGVWVCLRHLEPLYTSTVKSNGVERFLWQLPSTNNLNVQRDEQTETSTDKLITLAMFITRLIDDERPDGWLDAALIQAVLRRKLTTKNWITHSGNVRVQRVADDYLSFCSPLRSIGEFSDLSHDREHAIKQVGRLLRPLRSGTHPLRLLIAVRWLFDDIDEFIAEYDSIKSNDAASSSNISPVQANTDNSTEQIKSTLIRLLGEGKSITATANELRISVATAMSWATAANIVVSHRPKIMSPALRASLICKLRSGNSKRQVASEFNVSTPTVSRVLQTEIGLQQEWQAARSRISKEIARSTWMALLENHNAAGIKLIRAMNPALYAWLYRNDREWLVSHSPRRRQIVSMPASSVNWDQRDRDLSFAVQRAALLLKNENTGRPLKLWQLYQAVPELKAKLSALNRLPLTARAIEIALTRHPADAMTGKLFETDSHNLG